MIRSSHRSRYVGFPKFLPQLLSVLLLVFVAGCGTYQNITGYFNTYYNAKRLFDESERETLQNPQSQSDTAYHANNAATSGSRPKFEKVIEKCSKLIQFYPKSTWVEDAIVMIGKSYVYLGNYEPAIRKFKEFNENFPTSGDRFEAKLWRARAEYFSKRPDEALLILKDLVPEARERDEREILLETLMLEAWIFMERGDFVQASSLYALAVQVQTRNDLRAIAQFHLGRCYEKLGETASAAKAYADVRRFSPSLQLDFRSRLRQGIMLTNLGQYDTAIDVLDALLDEPLKTEDRGLVDLEIAQAYCSMGDTAKAFELYAHIDTTYRRTEIVAKSFYRRGLLFEKTYLDLARARAYYETARSEFPGSSVATLALQKAANLRQYLTYRADIALIQEALAKPESTWTAASNDSSIAIHPHDSLAAAQDSGRTLVDKSPRLVQDADEIDAVRKQVDDEVGLKSKNRRVRGDERAEGAPEPQGRESTATDSKPTLTASAITPIQLPPSISHDSLRALLANRYYELAGLLYLEFELPDSAIVWYRQLATEFESSPLASRALYAMAEVYSSRGYASMVDSLYDIILRRYPASPYADQINRMRGLKVTPASQDSTEIQYSTAQQHLASGRPDSAVQLLKRIVRKNPAAPIAPRSMYAVGWIYEHQLAKYDSAAAWYRYLVAEHPTSTYANQVKPKVEAIDHAATADTSNKAIDVPTVQASSKPPPEEEQLAPDRGRRTDPAQPTRRNPRNTRREDD
jgi:tetratricopeptide (TPR) repeat protein